MSISFEKILQELREANTASSPAITEENLYVEGNLEKAIKIEELNLRKEEYNLAVQNRTERKKYAKHIFIVTCIWATLIFFIVIASGLKTINKKEYFSFIISDRVMITLITSTTINFFGFFLLVVKYLFHISGGDKSVKPPVVRRKPKATTD